MPADPLNLDAATGTGALGQVRALFQRPNDDPGKTIAVALALCLVCSVVVSATAVALRPLQERNAALALKQEIVAVAGVQADGSLDAAFDQIETRLVDLETGQFADDADPLTYSYRDAAQDPSASTALGDDDPADIDRRPNRMPVYLVRDDAGALETIILPVYGAGLWSTMHGLLALAPDGRTAKAFTIYEQRETAGLGSEVASSQWLSEWPGKVLIEDGQPVIEVVKGSVDPSAPNAEHRVDGLSGATLTSNGVTNLLQFWLGAHGYGPFLSQLTANRD
jgi:Na+-transporting NADH:ubiquinone oxidoreductase subunit C